MSMEQLNEKWSPIVNHPDLPEIKDQHRRQVTAVLLENTERALREERSILNEAIPTSATGNIQNYDPVLIGLVRRSMPQLIAYDICGVQPMTAPTGLVFALKSFYGDGSTEALFNEANPAYSASETAAKGTSPTDTGDDGLDPWASNAPGDYTKGPLGRGLTGVDGTDPQNWGASDGLTMNQMTFKIDKFSVAAKSRALKAEYTMELQQDLKAVHGLDAEAELSNILSNEIVAEINREVIRTVYYIAKTGAQETTTAGTFDLDVDSNGRWSVERFKGLHFQLEREANRISELTRRGKGNWILCSADVASALSLTGMLDTGAALGKGTLNIDEANSTFVGTLNGQFKVYVDPYQGNIASGRSGTNSLANQFCVVGYKGSSPFDAGLFYCPYVPLQLMRAVDPATFQPKIGFKTRYGLTSHPLSGDASTLAAKSNAYFRAFRVTNIA
jgi:hypothetical protein